MVFAGGGATVNMNPPPVVYFKVFHPGSGPDRSIRRQAEAVALTAKVLAPRRSGRLATSIKVDQNRDERGRFAFGYDVYTPVHYGYYVHEGTAPHVIYPTNHLKMKFAGTKRFYGQMVFPRVVFHPGTRAQPFLRDALAAMGGLS